MGSGSQRIWLGGVGSSSNGPLRMRVCVAERLVGFVDDRGADAVHPGAAVLAARRGEGGAADLFGVEAERIVLGRVLADREAVRLGLGGEFISKS